MLGSKRVNYTSTRCAGHKLTKEKYSQIDQEATNTSVRWLPHYGQTRRNHSSDKNGEQSAPQPQASI